MHWMYQSGIWGSSVEASGLGPLLAVLIPFLIIWTLIWKGWALWLAARRGERIWFVVLLIVNTLGILDIIYIFAIAKRRDTKPQQDVVGT